MKDFTHPQRFASLTSNRSLVSGMHMSFLQHKEGVKSWFRPRHPFVAVHDVVIAGAALVLVGVTEEWTRLYFVVLLLMFAASALHHWLSYLQ